MLSYLKMVGILNKIWSKVGGIAVNYERNSNEVINGGYILVVGFSFIKDRAFDWLPLCHQIIMTR